MAEPVTPRRMAFVHLMKAAGSYVDSYLTRRILLPGGYAIYNSWSAPHRLGRDWSEAELDEIRERHRDGSLAYVHNHVSHWPAGALTRFRDDGWLLFTFVREPGDQRCSFYSWSSTRHSHLVERHTLDQFVARSIQPDDHYAKLLDLPPGWRELDEVSVYRERAFADFLWRHFRQRHFSEEPRNISANLGYARSREAGLISAHTAALLDASRQARDYQELLQRPHRSSRLGTAPEGPPPPVRATWLSRLQARAGSRARRGAVQLRDALRSRFVPRADAPAVPFVIWFLHRSGSSHLATLLDSHPQVRCRGEVLAPGHELTQEEAHERAWRALRSARHRAAGYKLKYQQREAYPKIWEDLRARKRELRLICLVRENLLKQAVSGQNVKHMMAAGRGANLLPGDASLGSPLRVDAERILGQLRDLEALRERLRHDAGEFPLRLELTYEELVSDEARVLDRVQRFLGVEPQPLTPKFAKSLPDRLEDAVVNYGELCGALAGTPFERYLEE